MADTFGIERAPTGIEGLDDLIEGGFPRGYVILVTGTPGTAKTTFGMQFIVNGALKHNENGLYIGPSSYFRELKAQFMRYGYDLEKLQNEGKILVVTPRARVEEGEDLVNVFDEDLQKKIVSHNIKRVTIDPLTLMLMFSKEFGGRRRILEKLVDYLKESGVTALLTHERSLGSAEEIEYGMEEFVVDGIVYLQLIRVGNLFKRAITILKLRGTKHPIDIHLFDLAEEGIRIYPSNIKLFDR